MIIDRLPTPALILEETVFRANRNAMTELLQHSSLSLRPHYKSHKCTAIAHMQIADGAVGMTCAKLSEAEDLADSGIDDILIANQITDPRKIRRAAELAGDCRLTVCTDNLDNIAALEKAAAEAGTKIRCLVEFEIGMCRCGVTSFDEVVDLAGEITASSHLVFDGIQAYAGHISHVVSQEERIAATEQNEAVLRQLLDVLEVKGLAARVLSGGSTGTAAIKAKSGVYTELQAGSYLFMDATYRELQLPFMNALFVLSTVVSEKSGLTVLDAGVKSCGVDQGMPVPVGFTVGEVRASEEHFQLAVPERMCGIGSRVKLVPGHCCSTVNLYDKIYVTDGDTVVDRLTISARGCSR